MDTLLVPIFVLKSPKIYILSLIPDKIFDNIELNNIVFIVNMSLNFLTSLDLTPKEISLYELMLTLGESPAGIIISKSGLKRATAYKLLYSLIDKKLASQTKVKKKIHFRPAPPNTLSQLFNARQKELSDAKSSLDALISDLNSSYLLSVEKPIVTTFEGVSGLKKIYLDTLKEGKTIYALLQTGEVNPELFEWLTKDYVKRRVKSNIKAHVIVAIGDWSEEYSKRNQKESRDTVLVPSIKFPFEHEINIYGNKVAIIQGKKNELPIGIIIQHPIIARTFKAWFDLAALGAKTFTSN